MAVRNFQCRYKIYTKKEIDDLLENIDLSDYYTKSEIDTMLENVGSDYTLLPKSDWWDSENGLDFSDILEIKDSQIIAKTDFYIIKKINSMFDGRIINYIATMIPKGYVFSENTNKVIMVMNERMIDYDSGNPDLRIEMQELQLETNNSQTINLSKIDKVKYIWNNLYYTQGSINVLGDEIIYDNPLFLESLFDEIYYKA